MDTLKNDQARAHAELSDWYHPEKNWLLSSSCVMASMSCNMQPAVFTQEPRDDIAGIPYEII